MDDIHSLISCLLYSNEFDHEYFALSTYFEPFPTSHKRQQYAVESDLQTAGMLRLWN